MQIIHFFMVRNFCIYFIFLLEDFWQNTTVRVVVMVVIMIMMMVVVVVTVMVIMIECVYKVLFLILKCDNLIY